MDFLIAETLPWLGSQRRRLQEARAARRLPHSALLLSIPGLGAEHLANWLGALALCEAAGARPCGACASCSLLRSDSHPDYHRVRLEEDAKQIKVDQIRELIGVLGLKSYRGGYKLGIIEGAEAMNVNAANAFLKTLEEPSADTMLVLIAPPNHRLPATIVSRCLRMELRPPADSEALAWLDARQRPRRNWRAALDLAGGAPLSALDFDDAGIDVLDQEMEDGVKALAAGAVDVTLLAEQWAKSHANLRVLWLENWITRRIRAGSGEGGRVQNARPARLPDALLKPKIRSLFDVLDATREIRRLASTGINQQLALEALLLGARHALEC